MQALGRLFDICSGFVPVNMATAANTGHRLHLRNYAGVAFVFFKGAGGAAEAPTITVQEHTANTGGTSRTLAAITEYYTKSEASLDGDETWTRVTQAAAGTITNADWDDANEVLLAFEVQAAALSADCAWISANVADVGTTAQLGALLYLPYQLRYPQRPDGLAQPNA